MRAGRCAPRAALGHVAKFFGGRFAARPDVVLRESRSATPAVAPSQRSLLFVGLKVEKSVSTQLLTHFIALNYLSFGVWQLLLAWKSGISGASVKMFQWVFFFIIAVLALLGGWSN